MTTIPDRTTFEALYAGQAPWDIGKPQKLFIDMADRINGSILDAGCGTGDTALFFAGRGTGRGLPSAWCGTTAASRSR
jgi:hypothetical protein